MPMLVAAVSPSLNVTMRPLLGCEVDLRSSSISGEGVLAVLVAWSGGALASSLQIQSPFARLRPAILQAGRLSQELNQNKVHSNSSLTIINLKL